MARCYMMIEDVEGLDDDGGERFHYAVDWGLGEGEELPENVNDLTLAQDILRMMADSVRVMQDPGYKKQIMAERSKQVVVPEHVANSRG